MGQNNAKISFTEWFGNLNKNIATILKSVNSYNAVNYGRLIAITDRQDAINRYKWFNLPNGLTGEMIERILYLKGQGMLYKNAEKFYFLPYTLSSSSNGSGIDCYGRYNQVTPVSMGSAENPEGKPIIKGDIYDVLYDIALEDFEDTKAKKKAVLLHDYSCDWSQYNIPRVAIQKCIIDQEAEMFPMMHTALINHSGVRGMRCNSSDEASDVDQANFKMHEASITGKSFVPVVGKQDFQDFSGESNSGEPEAYMSALQSLENFRKKCLGISTDGLLQKNQHVLTGEHEMNASSSDSQIQDGLYQRQMFCIIAESIWHLGIWCEVNSTGEMTSSETDNGEFEEDSGGGDNADINE